MAFKTTPSEKNISYVLVDGLIIIGLLNVADVDFSISP